MNLWIYGQWAQFADHGWGSGAPGLKFNFMSFRAGIEYRHFEEEFLGNFFDFSYESERVVYNEATDTYVTKEDRLDAIDYTANGVYAEAGFNFFGFLDLFAAYQWMNYSKMDNLKTLYGRATLNTTFVPRLDLAEAYYNQPYADNVFDWDADGTILGYKLGISLADGVMLIYDNKSIYYNGQPNRIITIETAVSF